MVNRFENSEFLDTLETIRRELEPNRKHRELRKQIRNRESSIAKFSLENASMSDAEKQIATEQHQKQLEMQRVEIERILQSLGY